MKIQQIIEIYKQYKPLFVLRDNQLELVNYPPPYPSFDTLRKFEDEKTHYSPAFWRKVW